jgi:poly-gamma-glutamate capsule biosynthesis protein CapA/YwtB (metallophosphatase superfamily)
VVVAFAGDVHAELQIARTLHDGGNPLEAMAPVFARADVTVVNLETAVGTGGEPAVKAYTFLAPPTLWSALASAGVDVVSLANNHSLDFGAGLLPSMLEESRRHGVQPVGAGMDAAEAYAPAIFDVGGRRVAVVGLTRVIPRVEWAATSTRPGLASAYDDSVAVAAVERAAEQADHVVVTIHWGREGADCVDEHQKRLGDRLVAAGADVVAGHHPHVLQAIVAKGPSMIAYSLGNFVWYTQGPVGRLTGVLLVTLDDGGVAGWELSPAVIGPSGSPAPAVGADAAAIEERVRRLSDSPAPCPRDDASSGDDEE